MFLSTMETVTCLHFTVAIIVDVHTNKTQLMTGLHSLREIVNALYEYMGVLANHSVNLFYSTSQ